MKYICDFLEFLWVKSPKIFTAHCILQDTNFKHEKKQGLHREFLIIDCKCMSFYTTRHYKILVLVHFSEMESALLLKSNIYYQSAK